MENWARVNFGGYSDFDQRKGLQEGTQILLDGVVINDWEIIALQFKSKWIKR